MVCSPFLRALALALAVLRGTGAHACAAESDATCSQHQGTDEASDSEEAADMTVSLLQRAPPKAVVKALAVSGDKVPGANNTTLSLSLVSDNASDDDFKCSRQEYAHILSLGGGDGEKSFPTLGSNCFKHSYDVFWGLNTRTMSKCVQREIGISASCAQCYVDVAKAGTDNCEWQCLGGCAQGCVECLMQFSHQSRVCVGGPSPQNECACKYAPDHPCCPSGCPVLG
mmetsp:Transcript_22073/g.61858  ORF Transcript_22073/g.61858 Transcript_22073/m.61858 type:complete len:227 (-) Transcript_22073:79-759(-)